MIVQFKQNTILQAEKTTQSAPPLNTQDRENPKKGEAEDFALVVLEKNVGGDHGCNC